MSGNTEIEKQMLDDIQAIDECPCNKCGIRKFYARRFDMHFMGDDCVYECTAYKNWKLLKLKEERV